MSHDSSYEFDSETEVAEPRARYRPRGAPLAAKIWMSLLLLALAGYMSRIFWKLSQREQRSNIGIRQDAHSTTEALPEAGHTVSPFKLTERSGQEFDSRELQGKVWIASFFFSNCAGACLRMNNSLAALQEEFSDLPIRFVSITVDPERDTPERLREYSAHYRPLPERWVFLTGDVETIKRIAVEDFHVPYAREVHSERLIVIDQRGQIFGHYKSGDEADLTKLRRDVKRLTQEGS